MENRHQTREVLGENRHPLMTKAMTAQQGAGARVRKDAVRQNRRPLAVLNENHQEAPNYLKLANNRLPSTKGNFSVYEDDPSDKKSTQAAPGVSAFPLAQQNKDRLPKINIKPSNNFKAYQEDIENRIPKNYQKPPKKPQPCFTIFSNQFKSDAIKSEPVKMEFRLGQEQHSNLPSKTDHDESVAMEDSPAFKEIQNIAQEMVVDHTMLSPLLDLQEDQKSKMSLELSQSSEGYSEEDYFISATYLDDIYPYVREREVKLRASPNYMNKQPDVTNEMRSILVDWLVEVADEYNFSDETLFLTINYVDRFLSSMSIVRSKFQLLGTAALFIAAKFEEIYTPSIEEYVSITDKTYTKQQLKRMEHLLLQVLEFDLSVPTPLYFLRIYIAIEPLPEVVKYLARYLCELTLLKAEPFLRFKPSEIACCSYALANFTTNRKMWTDKLAQFSGYELSDVIDCMNCLYQSYQSAPKVPHKAVREKYTSAKYQCVGSLVAPSKSPFCC